MKQSSGISGAALSELRDTDLMLRAQNEMNSVAFATLVERIDRPVRQALRRILPAPEVEDGVAEVVLRLWESRERYQPERGSARTWAVSIARNVARDWWRRNSKRQGHATLNDNVKNSSLPDPGNQAECRDWYEFVRRSCDAALASQPEYVRASFELRLQGVSFRQLSERLGKPSGSIAGALHRFRRSLAAGLDPDFQPGKFKCQGTLECRAN